MSSASMPPVAHSRCLTSRSTAQWAQSASAVSMAQFIINPTYEERKTSDMNIMVVGTANGIVMVESGSKEVSEDSVADAIDFGHVEIKKIVCCD